MSQSQQCEIRSLWFDDLYELLDAVMLFGAQIEPGKDPSQARIAIARGRGRWPALYWMLTLLWRHRIDMQLTSGARTTDKLVFCSRLDRFFMPAARRWYGESPRGDNKRVAIAPADLTLTESMLVAWLVDAMAASARDQTIRLTAPWMTRELASRLRWHVQRLSPLSPRIECVAERHRLVLPPRQQSVAARWLAQWVPPAIWGG